MESIRSSGNLENIGGDSKYSKVVMCPDGCVFFKITATKLGNENFLIDTCNGCLGDESMSERPKLNNRLDSSTFRSYYYLKEELIHFCRQYDLPVS